MFKMYGVFGLVIMDCFFYLFLVRLILVFIEVKFCDSPGTLAIETCFAFTYFDGINVYCVLVLIKVLYICGFDVLG